MLTEERASNPGRSFGRVADRLSRRSFLHGLIGVLVWRYFATCLTKAATSLSGNAGLIKQVFFPREVFALSAAGSNLIITLLSLFVAVPAMAHYGFAPTASILLVFVGLFLTALFGLGLGLMVACINVVYRDIEHFLRFVVRAGFFLSPVMWTLNTPRVDEVLDKILFNPMVVPISMVRSGIEGHGLSDKIQPGHILYSVGMCALVFILGTMFFKRFEGEVVKNL